eukprot:CAMPEP_0203940838 /NCGR_PEP_ID=MMETSP0359-20131031/77334_1 /ASSEMBLY_ACC=CAM_ASM_000338 /TAXON_ID=268821 /ORGANISM="Scrippsiella Hangoei, Strain SHTV-5" /LENGTH=248 /DNA_ID=CAMNT_0050871315 /DNA_START=53 /DNA_END=799 /DNA_ORIENTATION=-
MGQRCCSLEHGGGDADDRNTCVCGSRFAADSLYCGKCGHKRPDDGHAVWPEVRLIAWMRRRNGVDCDFATVFEDLFGSREAVNVRRFEEVLRSKGYKFDAKAAFSRIDRHAKSGAVGASDFELMQVELEEREGEGLKHLRDFLKSNFSSPSAAFKELGKGEGDELTQAEFIEAMHKLGFTSDDPAQVFQFLDKDFSGEVSFSEFKSLLKVTTKKFKDGHGHGKDRSPRHDGGKERSPRSHGHHQRKHA